jgi:hypothetical protein
MTDLLPLTEPSPRPEPSSLAEQLLHRVDAYAARVGLSAARISTLAVNDGDLVRRLREGKTLTVRTFEKFMAWLAEAERKLVPEDVQ